MKDRLLTNCAYPGIFLSLKIEIEITPFTKAEAGIYRYATNLLTALKAIEPSVKLSPMLAGSDISLPPTNPQLFTELFGCPRIPVSYQFTKWGGRKAQGSLIRFPHAFEAAYSRHARALKKARASREMIHRWVKLKREFYRYAGNSLNVIRNLPYKQLTRQYVNADTAILHSLYDALPADLGPYRPKLICQTVHDTIPLLFPVSYHKQFEKIMASARRADLLIVISEATKRDLLTLEGFRAENIEVIPLAAAPIFQPSPPEKIRAIRHKTGIPDDLPYFLSVSTLEPRKNFPFLLKAFKKLISTPGAPPCRLVLTGAIGWGDIWQEITPLLEELKDHVHYTGFVSDEELAALYTGAEAFLFPSLYEGFGLPILEAMACGTTIICSNTSSLPEVAGDTGVLLSPHEESLWVDAMNQALLRTEEEKRRDSSAAKSRANLFSWEKTARLTMAAYEKALARKGMMAASV